MRVGGRTLDDSLLVIFNESSRYSGFMHRGQNKATESCLIEEASFKYRKCKHVRSESGQRINKKERGFGSPNI